MCLKMSQLKDVATKDRCLGLEKSLQRMRAEPVCKEEHLAHEHVEVLVLQVVLQLVIDKLGDLYAQA